MEKENIKIEGYSGTWYVIGEAPCGSGSRKTYLLQQFDTNEDMTKNLIVDEDKQVILDDVRFRRFHGC